MCKLLQTNDARTGLSVALGLKRDECGRAPKGTHAKARKRTGRTGAFEPRGGSLSQTAKLPPPLPSANEKPGEDNIFYAKGSKPPSGGIGLFVKFQVCRTFAIFFCLFFYQLFFFLTYLFLSNFFFTYNRCLLMF